ncbi:hypothetical protein ABS770_24005, partial [Methylobacterium brachiatum]
GIQLTPAVRLMPNLQYVIGPDQTRFPLRPKPIPFQRSALCAGKEGRARISDAPARAWNHAPGRRLFSRLYLF